MNTRIYILFSMIFFAGCSSTPSSDSVIASKLAGTWDETPTSNCGVNYHTISFKDSMLELKYVEKGYISQDDARQVLRYNILSTEDEFLRVQLVGETRLDNEGHPVVWHIKPRGNDQYCWGRDDWPKDGCTPPRYKCNSN
ncbi:hypothetical protein [Shewanella sedimentimangrovi]|uniref:Lipoprotein n=1 Tax=Shewanella sedimentimangrovi TaxID=2814293 RepID=A0ABX7R3C8_9GAMM|nr:hypothetical protein [Shewanella sedimentimangrovi]QSX38229.1 hypothetical protein JYB85_05230 [Shewanella sedimentimangrovi]